MAPARKKTTKAKTAAKKAPRARGTSEAERDRALVLAAKEDPAAFGALYRRYAQKIYNYFWYRVGHDRDVAEDLTQETFVRAFEHLRRYRQRSGTSYYAYLVRIAHNLLVNYYRTPRPIPLEAVGPVPVEIWEEIERKDLAEKLWRAIQQLPARERDILLMHYHMHFPVKKIARLIARSENAVKLALSRARKKLARHPYLSVIAHFKEVEMPEVRRPAYLRRVRKK